MCVRSYGPWKYNHGMPQPNARSFKLSQGVPWFYSHGPHIIFFKTKKNKKNTLLNKVMSKINTVLHEWPEKRPCSLSPLYNIMLKMNSQGFVTMIDLFLFLYLAKPTPFLPIRFRVKLKLNPASTYCTSIPKSKCNWLRLHFEEKNPQISPLNYVTSIEECGVISISEQGDFGHNRWRS